MLPSGRKRIENELERIGNGHANQCRLRAAVRTYSCDYGQLVQPHIRQCFRLAERFHRFMLTSLWKHQPGRQTLYNPQMPSISWGAIAFGSLLIVSAFSNGGQAQPPQPDKAQPQRGRILGIGGVFFKSADRNKTRDWYASHLGLADKGQGAILPWREHDDPQKEHVTAWTVFPSTTKYFDPSPASFMINYIVDAIWMLCLTV